MSTAAQTTLGYIPLGVVSRNGTRRRVGPPRAVLLGGSVPGGGTPPSCGHAGRKSLARVVTVLVTLIATCVAILLAPRPAQALSESMSFYKNPVDYSMSVSSYRTADGDVAYCCNKTLPHENGLVYTKSEYATGRWGYVAYHGYPTTTTIEGTSLTDGQARSATQWAVWMLNGDDVESDPYFTGSNIGIKTAAYALRDSALAYESSGVDGPENHFGRLYYPPAGSLQNFLAVPGTGSIEITKVSGDPAATQDNACYSLEGAVFCLYADEACTKVVGEATTDAAGKAVFESVSAGTYWVREKTAPAGYALDEQTHQVEASSPAGTLEISEAPQRYRAGMLVRKVDADTGEPSAQGDATLAGAEFTVKHYPAILDAGEASAKSPDATWIIATDDSGEAWLDDKHLTGGDALPKDADGTVAIPLGTLVVEETKAPKGYLLPDAEAIVIKLEASGTNELIDFPEATTIQESVERGGIRLGKVDLETGEATPLGMAKLEGAVYAVINSSESPVVVDGTSFAPEEVVTTLTTDREGSAKTPDDLLPFGTYTVREVVAPEGYLLDADWSREVTIDAQGLIGDLFSADSCPADQVKRGDIRFSKVDGQTMARLAGVAFRLTLLEDAYGERIGESHVIVTDENGMFDSSALVCPHSVSTNASDEAVSDDGHVDKSRLAPDAGIWFSGRNTLSTSANDGLGALPYGTYLLEELRSSANEGHSLVRVTFTVRGHGRSYDLGTIDDNPLGIQTTLEERGGDATVSADGIVTLVDTIDYRGLTPGEEYVMHGTLHRRSAQGDDLGELVNSDGSAVTGEVTFVPSSPEGTVEVPFEFDASGLEGASVVAFEECLEQGQVVVRHEDIACESQTVRFAGIATTATDASDGDHIVTPNAHATIVDTVTFQGLIPGETYQLVGTIHVRGADGSDQGPLTDDDGKPVTSSAEFTPSEENGTTEVVFELDATGLEDASLVVFEQLSLGGEIRATHEDISDEGQTVYVSRKPEAPRTPVAPKPTGATPSTGDATNRTRPFFLFLAGLMALSGAAVCSVAGPRLKPARVAATHGARHAREHAYREAL